MAAMGPKSSDDLAASLQHFGLERDRMRAALARHAGVSATDLDALEHLEFAGPLTQRELGERLSITSGAVTMLVDRLEAAGWVVRRPHPSDRRYTVVELAAKAAEREPPGLAMFHASIHALVAAVPVRERRALASLLEAAAQAASNATRDLHGGPGATGRGGQ